jgi:hypothetical protein
VEGCDQLFVELGGVLDEEEMASTVDEAQLEVGEAVCYNVCDIGMAGINQYGGD